MREVSLESVYESIYSSSMYVRLLPRTENTIMYARNMYTARRGQNMFRDGG